MANKRQSRIIHRLLTQAVHHLGEIGLPFVIVIEGADTLHTNSSQPHAVAMLRDVLEVKDAASAEIARRKAELKADQMGLPGGDEADKV